MCGETIVEWERKQGQIAEKSRAVRFRANLSLQYLGHCVLLTAFHIINSLPSPVIGNKSLYELLFKKFPHVHPLTVLGCLAFASNPIRRHEMFVTIHILERVFRFN